MNSVLKKIGIGILFLNSFYGVTQNDHLMGDVGDCNGAILLSPNTLLKPKIFKGPGTVMDVENYSKSLKLTEVNSLWLKFEADYSGELRLAFEKFDFALEYCVFILKEHQTCDLIREGSAKVFTHQYMDQQAHSASIDSIHYNKGEVILLYLNTVNSDENTVAIKANFEGDVSPEEFSAMKEEFDLRSSADLDPYIIKVRDAKTKLPLTASIIVSDTRGLNALYTASDLIVPNSENLKMKLKIDAEGYFFQDVVINNRREEAKEKVIYLIPLEQNQLIELEGLIFESHSDVLIPEAMLKLKRLKDFMLMNTSVQIEIQGHVHLSGRNTFAAKRLSKKRAKTVRTVLVESGISKKRISVKGFGNSMMKFPEAETDLEKQANRRVEIKIK